jgi:16S rRNA (guanine(966)-N(2))-methyltransferase RsmD
LRIIGGTKKGILIQAPTNLPVRPTTDRSKESLFNILQHSIEIEGIEALDLFTGTGNISYELASRGAQLVMSVDKDFGCFKFVKETASKLGFGQIQARKQDVFSALKQLEQAFDLIFADPPYALADIVKISTLVLERNLLKPEGILIIEHATSLDLSQQKGFFESRKYGQSSFSFFKSNQTN